MFISVLENNETKDVICRKGKINICVGALHDTHLIEIFL
jgi:hypothetical protein